MLKELVNASQKTKNSDIFTFLPVTGSDTQVRVECISYVQEQESVPSGGVGNIYDVILVEYKEDEDGVKTEHFEAVLIDPMEYVSRMINLGIHGVVARKTTTSYDGFVCNILKSLHKEVTSYA